MVGLDSGSDMGKLLAAIVVAAMMPLASACVVEAGAGVGGGGGMAVSGPPPPPMREEGRPPPPKPRCIWVAGYWHWTGMQYTWIPGHWEEQAPGREWRAPRYSIRDGQYFYEPGGWVGR
jgi:hypothetical protein